MLARLGGLAAGGMLPALVAAALRAARLAAPAATQTRGMLWSVEREKGHTYRDTKEIIDDRAISEALESTKELAKDPKAIQDILTAARERSFLTNITPGTCCV